jgi:hypothetical protein
MIPWEREIYVTLCYKIISKKKTLRIKQMADLAQIAQSGIDPVSGSYLSPERRKAIFAKSRVSSNIFKLVVEHWFLLTTNQILGL